MPRRPTIRQRMNEYNELARQAQARGIFVREYRNLRVSNTEATARVEALRQRLNLMSTSSPTAIAVAAGNQGFGVELEFFIPSHTSMAALAIRLTQAGIQTTAEMYNHTRRSTWKLVTDASLGSVTGKHGMELVSPILYGQAGLDAVTKACEIITAAGAIVNRKCGLHVHCGVIPANDNPEFFKRLVAIYRDHEQHIDSFMAPSRRGSANSYCKSLSMLNAVALNMASNIAQVVTAAGSTGYTTNDRYVKLNLQSYWRHRTVEFRHHQGTTDAVKAVMWVRLCLKIVASASGPAKDPVNTLNGFLRQIEATPEESAYFLQRLNHFGTLAGLME